MNDNNLEINNLEAQSLDLMPDNSHPPSINQQSTFLPELSHAEIFESTKTLQAAVNAYFNYCDTKQKCPTLNGLALSLSITRTQINRFPEDSLYYPIILKAKQRIAALVEELLLTSRNSTGAFAWLKNNDDWADKSEVKNIKQLTAAEVLKRMSEGQPIDGELVNEE